MSTESPKSKDMILTPEKVAEALGRPLKEVQSDLVSAEQRGVLAHRLLTDTNISNAYGGDVQKIKEHLDAVAKTLESKGGFFNRLKQAGSWIWDKTKAVLTNKYVLTTAAVIGLAAAAYFGWKYLPSWDEVMAWVQRMRGVGAANTAATGVSAPGYAGAKVAEKLVSGGVTSTASADKLGGATNLLNLLQQSPGLRGSAIAGK